MSSESPCVVGIDAGGSSTRACLANADGTILATATSDTGNFQAIGTKNMINLVTQLITCLCRQANVSPERITRMEIGAAGLDRKAEHDELLSALQATNLAKSFGVQADSLIALYAGTLGRPGIVLIAGTGSIADGINAHGKRCRVGGWGYFLGDEGSGYDIGHKALRAVARASDGRGEPTKLTQRILSYFHIQRPEELIRIVYQTPLPPKEIAKIAPIVGEEAARGDEIAQTIIQHAAEELALAVWTVGQALEMTMQPVTIHLAGGLIKLGKPFIEPLKNAITKHLPSAIPQVLSLSPVVGAVLLALKANGSLTPHKLSNLEHSARKFHLKLLTTK